MAPWFSDRARIVPQRRTRVVRTVGRNTPDARLTSLENQQSLSHADSGRIRSSCRAQVVRLVEAGVDFNSVVDVVGERTGKDEVYMLDSGKLISTSPE